MGAVDLGRIALVGIFHSAHLITLERRVSLLKGTIYGNGLIPLFWLFRFFCLLIKCEVTKQLNSSAGFRQKVGKAE